ncbi:flagellar hook-basal body complex protein FliE [Igneacidithiobacillus siniensis]|uniref:flagellar hook-basal body complex protein FliE n=1 Tax=Acidithiobacillus TaxID=119977 RepID=UPI00200E41C6|nr:flagellar hook-basal body complex protein FliE [Acidithiobacillus sp. S30A2]
MSSVESLDSLLSQLRALSEQAQGLKTNPQGTGGVGDFADTLKKMVDGVNAQQSSANTLQNQFASGDPGVSLSQVMVASQKADLSFQTMLQVRNKLVSAYQDIMNISA